MDIRTKNIFENFAFTITSDLEMYFLRTLYIIYPTSTLCAMYEAVRMRRYSVVRQTERQTDGRTDGSLKGARPFYQFLCSLRILLQKLYIITHPNGIPE